MTLRQFNLIDSAEGTKRAARDYMKSHREEWSSLGFRNITYMVHDSERELILAELDVRRCDKLIALAEDRTNDNKEVLERLSRRNMPKPPEPRDIGVLRLAAKDSVADKDVTRTLDILQHMLKKRRALIVLFGNTVDRDTRVRIAARGVAYSTSAVARYRLAKAVLAYAGQKPRAVFGVEGSKAAAIERAWEQENG